jgi:hypothetical protein
MIVQGLRPATPSVVIRLSSANSLDPHVDPSKLRNIKKRQFGDKSSANGKSQSHIEGYGPSYQDSTPNLRGNARPSTANPSSAGLVYSTISPGLKLELRRHVPMYNHGEMGRIFYRQTQSKILRPTSATGVYKGILKAPPRPVHIRPKEIPLPQAPLPGPRASIQNISRTIDTRVEKSLGKLFTCKSVSKPYSRKNQRATFEQQKEQTLTVTGHNIDGRFNTLGDSMDDRGAGNRGLFSLKKTFTVLDSAHREAILTVPREKVSFQLDHNFLTLAPTAI